MKTEARRLLHLERPDQAISILQSGMAQLGGDAESHGLMGAALARVGNDTAAVSHFEQAVRLDPSRASNHYNLGVAYEKTARQDWALEGYKQALLRDPNFEQAFTAYYRLAPILAAGPSANSPLPSSEETITSQMTAFPQPETVGASPPVPVEEPYATPHLNAPPTEDDERTF
jgi:tetratricopeptide (TPR) repeat protein